MRYCKLCGAELKEEEEYLCDKCLFSPEMECTPLQDVVAYIKLYLPLPAYQSEYSKLRADYITRIYARSAAYYILNELYQDKSDDPADKVMDIMIDLHNMEKLESNESELFALDIYAATMSDIRHYLLAMGYGRPSISRY